MIDVGRAPHNPPMGAITSLEHRNITVRPGGEANCSVLVRNTGTVVDQFTVDVLGDAKAWARVDPGTVNLLPDEESTVVISFRPPMSPDTAAGPMPFGVRVNSREDRAGSVIEEGTLEVERFTDIRLELVPRRPRGRRQAKCEVAVDNLGNYPVSLDLDAIDPDRNLRFRPEHTALTLQSGTTTFVGLVVHPEQAFLRGPDRTYPFQVRATGQGLTPTVAEGAMLQQPLLPKWLPLALAALLALVIALVALWFTVFKTSIQSTARQAAAKQVQQVAKTANDAKQQADVAEKVASGVIPPRIGPHVPPPGSPSGANQPPTSASAAPSTPPSTPNVPGGAAAQDAISFRLAADAKRAANNNDFTAYPSDLPADKTALISDLVLQNPFGDSGILQILRKGVDKKDTVLLEVGLNNFRDLDYHFVEPLLFKPGEKIVLAVNCQNPAGQANCKPSVSFSGRID